LIKGVSLKNGQASWIHILQNVIGGKEFDTFGLGIQD